MPWSAAVPKIPPTFSAFSEPVMAPEFSQSVIFTLAPLLATPPAMPPSAPLPLTLAALLQFVITPVAEPVIPPIEVSPLISQSAETVLALIVPPRPEIPPVMQLEPPATVLLVSWQFSTEPFRESPTMPPVLVLKPVLLIEELVTVQFLMLASLPNELTSAPTLPEEDEFVITA